MVPAQRAKKPAQVSARRVAQWPAGWKSVDPHSGVDAYFWAVLRQNLTGDLGHDASRAKRASKVRNLGCWSTCGCLDRRNREENLHAF
jgi:hypothetical protein